MFRTSRRLYLSQLHNAIENVSALLEKGDRLSYLLAQYIPEPVRPTFLAIRAFGLEINKISNIRNSSPSIGGFSSTDLKFKFWSDLLSKAFADQDGVTEPIAFLLRDGLRNGANLDISHFQRFLQTRRHFLQNSGFQTSSDICSYGEGTYSQLMYATQGCSSLHTFLPSVIHMLEMSTSLQDKVSEIAAHIGQSTSVTLMILGFNYYASSQNQVTLPVDLMTKFDVSQEAVLLLAQGHGENDNNTGEKLKSVVFETAITANDHVLSARQKLAQLRTEIDQLLAENRNDKLLTAQSKRWRRGLPDVIFTPLMSMVPTTLYLNKLEKYDFDVFSKKILQKEWRLPWTSFRSYYQRKI